MSSDTETGVGGGGGGDLRKPFLHTGSWYRMGSRQSSLMGSSQVIRDSSVSVVACVLIVALGPIQFGFTVNPNYPSSISLNFDFQLTSNFFFFLLCPFHHNLECCCC